MTINRDKCKFNWDVINYLGFQISKQSTSPDPILFKKIEQVATPLKQKRIKILELANFYSRYLWKYSELIEPFNDLRKKE